MNTDPGLREEISRDLYLSRSTGAPLLGCLLGLRAIECLTGTGFALACDARPAVLAGVGITGLATLADLALGGAVRRRVGIAQILQTMTLTLQLSRLPGKQASVHAVESTEPVEGIAFTRAVAMDGAVVVGDCLATFNIPDAKLVATALPWELSVAEPDGPASQPDAAEVTIVRSLEAFASHWSGQPAWPDSEVEKACLTVDGADAYTAILHPTILMRNRAGNVQGAVLLGAAALVAGTRAAFHSSDLRTAHIRFIAAADSTRPLQLRAELSLKSRRTAFVTVQISQDARIAAEASFLFRR